MGNEVHDAKACALVRAGGPPCGSRKAMSLDFIEDCSTIGHPLIHGSLAPLSRLVVHLQPSGSPLPTAGGRGAASSALRVPVPAGPTTHCSGCQAALVHPGEAVVGLATCVVLRSAANGNALAEEAVSRLLAETEPKRRRWSAPDPCGVAAAH